MAVSNVGYNTGDSSGQQAGYGFNNQSQYQNSGASSNILGTSGQTATNIIPGAQPAYEQIVGNLYPQYGQLAGTLNQSYAGLQGSQQQSYSDLINKLNSANQGLTGQVAGGYQGLMNQAMGQTDQFGASERQAIENQYKQAGAQQQQSLVNRGLGNTTIQSSIDQGLNQSKAQALTGLDEQVQQQRLGVLSGFGNPYLQALQGLGTYGIGQNAALGQQAIQTQGQLGQGQIGAEAGTIGEQLAMAQQLGQQYLGLVGQQNVQTQTGQTAQAKTGYENVARSLSGSYGGTQANQNQNQGYSLGADPLSFLFGS